MSVAGGEGWHRGNRFDVSWSNPDQGQASPVAEARYRLCRAAASTDCREGRRAGTGIDRLHGSVRPRPGRLDAAGVARGRGRERGREPRLDAVHLRFDPQVDGAAFEASDRGDPRRLAVLVTDHASGVAPGTIQLRRRGAEAGAPCRPAWPVRG